MRFVNRSKANKVIFVKGIATQSSFVTEPPCSRFSTSFRKVGGNAREMTNHAFENFETMLCVDLARILLFKCKAE